MLVLFETAAGFGLFKVTDSGVLDDGSKLAKHFETPEAAANLVKLKAFHKFASTADALTDVSAMLEGKISKSLKKFLSDEISEKEKKKETLAIVDPKLAGSIQKKLGINIISNEPVLDLFRGIRSQLETLLTGLSQQDLSTMQLGLAHSLSRYKLKFSPDKVDTMIVQAIALLDDLDKELNTYAMRVKEWYGWHFPEMTKIITDNLAYARVVKTMGFRTDAAQADLATVLPEELETALRTAAEVSMGTEISQDDLENIHALCDQVISITSYRTQLYEYLKNRMTAIAPNLTALVGELVGARLIAHAGSLMSLAKHPASTIQILGAEKALFRALKTKHDTPKYGLIYHASLIGQASQKIKGKIARMVATKAAISVRVDALSEKDDASDMSIGLENRIKIESRLRQLEGRAVQAISTPGSRSKGPQKPFTYNSTSAYNDAMDSTLNGNPDENGKSKKRRSPDDEDDDQNQESKSVDNGMTPRKKSKKEKVDEEDEEESDKKKEKKEKKKEKKKDKDNNEKNDKEKANGDDSEKKKKKKEKRKSEVNKDVDGKKKKKKSSKTRESDSD